MRHHFEKLTKKVKKAAMVQHPWPRSWLRELSIPYLTSQSYAWGRPHEHICIGCMVSAGTDVFLVHAVSPLLLRLPYPAMPNHFNSASSVAVHLVTLSQCSCLQPLYMSCLVVNVQMRMTWTAVRYVKGTLNTENGRKSKAVLGNNP